MKQVFDCHFHIIDPRFPLIPNQSYLPESFTIREYMERVQSLNVVGGAVVSGSFQGFDQTYLLAALQSLGPSFVGVTQLPASVADDEIRKLHQAGVRAVRFNCKRGGSESLEHLEGFAKRVHELVGWHVELYIDSKELGSLKSLLLQLPAVSMDHLGLSKEGFPHLLFLVERGVKVKATGFGRVDFDVKSALQDLVSANPDGVMFGTDLPSTRAKRPFSEIDLQLIVDTFDEKTAEKILYSNAAAFYKISSPKREFFGEL